MEKEFDCLVCGTAVVDAIVKPVPLEEPIGKGKLLHVGPLAVTTGGLVCNAGMAMRKLGLKVSSVGLVGHDFCLHQSSCCTLAAAAIPLTSVSPKAALEACV